MLTCHPVVPPTVASPSATATRARQEGGAVNVTTLVFGSNVTRSAGAMRSTFVVTVISFE